MGRELRRKEEKKRKKSKKEIELDTKIQISTVFKILITCIIILFVLYYFLAVFVTKEINISKNNENNSENNNTNTGGVTNQILASSIFHQPEEEYYVYFYNFSDEDESISRIIENHSDWKIYRVDTNSSLNQNYVTNDNSNRNVTGLNDLKVKNPTLIRIENDHVVDYYEDKEEIVQFLSS